MSALAELWHIVRKDARQACWLLVGYGALVVVATLGAVFGDRLADGYLQLAAVLLIITGPIIAAILVQADSPTRADAFWASQPFRRPVMFGAKLVLVMGVLVGLPLLGQFVGLLGFALPTRDLLVALLVSALTYGSILLIAMLLGALTSDLRAFILGVLAVLGASVAMVIAVASAHLSWGASVLPDIVAGAGLIAMLLLLISLYLRRDPPAVRVLAVLALAMVLTTGVRTSDSTPPAGARPSDGGNAGIAVELRDTARIAGSARVSLQLALTGASGGRHYNLSEPRARFFLRGGAPLDLPFWEFGTGSLSDGGVTLPGVSSLQSNPDPFSSPMKRVDKDLSPTQRDALTHGVDSVVVTAVLTVLEPRVVATLPLRVGATAVRDGRIVTVEKLDLGASEESLVLAAKQVRSSQRDDWLDISDGLAAFIVDQRTGQGLELSRAGGGHSSGFLVLPGADLQQGTVTFRVPRTKSGDLFSTDAESLDEAKLVLVAWTPIASYGVHARGVPAADSSRASLRSHSSARMIRVSPLSVRR